MKLPSHSQLDFSLLYDSNIRCLQQEELGTRVIQCFSWCPDKWRRNVVPCLKPGICLARLVMAWSQGLGGTVTSDPGNLNPPPRELKLSIPRPLCAQSVTHLRYPEFLFKQHSLISLLLTSSHYMIAFCWFCPIFPCKLYIRCCTSGIRHQLMQDLLTPTFLSSLFFIPGPPSHRPVSKNNLLVQADRFLPSIMVRKAIINPAHLWMLHAKIMTGWPVCALLQQWHKHKGKTHYFLNEFTALSTTQYPYLGPLQRWESAAKQVTDLGENS